ncbi:unnamed protein product [Spirodela intermedia]|uniref:Uncharacterized protein n=1 Tax=Spirodela intermedia TaxID=51605 RepID=A0A7I8KSW2_SPIIN|nr:unnamed protein product [Spirodela intermedia]
MGCQLTPAAVTRRSRKTATLRLSDDSRGGSSSHPVCSQEVATHLLADRPLPDDGFHMEVGRMSRSFILRSAQQEEALHRIWYALRREPSRL